MFGTGPSDRNDIKKPLLTVVVAVFNGAGTLQRCIDSVDKQTYPRKELVIIDGGSSDGTIEILRENNEKIAYWESEPDRGIYHAWNKGLTHAKGSWINFLGADDYLWQSNVITRVVPHLIEALPNVRVVYGPVNFVRPDGTVIMKTGMPWNRRSFLRKTGGAFSVPHQGVFHHRSLFEVQGCFDESFRIAGDYDLLLRELKTANAKFVPDIIIAGMQQGGISSDGKHSVTMLDEIARSWEKNGIHGFLPSWYLAWTRVHVRQILTGCIGGQNSRYIANLYRKLRGGPQI
ncbi:MAG: glycosyltransferase [Proteobacteria bacterium]|nr:glycosyltransferase [Pseudomonadota bacterium]